MSKNAHFNPKSAKWIISLAIMIIVSVAVIFGTTAISKMASEKANQPVEIDYNISVSIPIAVQENELDVVAVKKALNDKGEIVAYVVMQEFTGYNQEVPIEMNTIISKDGKILDSIEITHQEETEYLGVKIMEDSFQKQFTAKKLPLKVAGSISNGSEVDLIAGSTISSTAVLNAVNNAQTYVNTLIEE